MKVRTKLVLAALAVAVVAAGALGGLVSNGKAAHKAETRQVAKTAAVGTPVRREVRVNMVGSHPAHAMA